MNIKPKNKILTLLITTILILSMLAIMPVTSAADTSVGVDVSPDYVENSSEYKPMLRLDTTADSGTYLKRVNLTFAGSGFATGDLIGLSAIPDSGVSIWWDDGDDTFETNQDSFITLNGAPQWAGLTTYLVLTQGSLSELGSSFFVAIKTSSSLSNGDVINVTVTGMQNNANQAISMSGGTNQSETSADTLDPIVPSNALTAPNGGEIWSGTQEITWNSTDITDTYLASTPITLYYSSNGGSSWTEIETNLNNNGSYSWDTSGLNGDNFKVNITAIDNASNTAYDISNASFSVDNTAPSCTIEYNQSDSYFKVGTKIKIYANFSEIGTASGINDETVNITITTQGNGGLSETNMNMTNNTEYFWNWTIPTGVDDNGTFTVSISAQDNASNPLGSTTDNSKSIDNSGPTATIGVPVNSDYYKTLNTINGSCTDGPGSGVNTVNITIYNASSGKYWNFSSGWADGVNWTSTDVGASYITWSFDSSDVTWANGTTYLINATATDNVSNVGGPDSNSFTYDTDGITSSVTQITPYWQTSSPLSVTYTAQDSGSGLKNATLYYRFSSDNSSFDDWVIWSGANNPDTTPWDPVSWNFNFPNGSGYYEFYTIAIDNVSNTETKSVNDTICGYDAVDPTAVITDPQNGGFNKSGDDIDGNITGTAYDPQFVTIVNLTIYNSTDGTYFDGTTWDAASANLTANTTSGTATINWWYEDTSAFPSWSTNKTYTINVSAKDTAGNWNLSAASSTFAYDATVPAAPIISTPADATWYNNTLSNISGTSSDDGGSKVQYVNIMIYNSTGGKYWSGSSWGDAPTNISANITGTGWNKNWYFSNTGTFPNFVNGTTYIINASSIDYAGNRGSNDSNTFYYDANGITSSVTQITPYWQTSSPLSVTYTAQDSGSGLKNATLYYRYSSDNSSFDDWVIWSGANNPDTTPWDPVTWSFDTPNGSGYYEFYTIAIDNVSNTETKSVNDTICGYDSADPTVSITVPENNNFYNSMNWINGSCGDTGTSGVNRVNITIFNQTGNTYWNGADWASGLNWTQTTEAGSPYSSWSCDTSGVTWQDTAIYRINATVVDNATRTDSDSNLFTYDTTAPNVSIWMNESTYVKQNEVVRIYANFTEATSGMNESSINISIKNATGTLLDYGTAAEGATRTDNTHWYYDWTVPAGNDGQVNVSVVANDNVSYSLTGTTWNTTKRIDNTAPTVTIEYNRSATYFKQGDKLKIYANFTETGSGMNETSITIAFWRGVTYLGIGSINKTDNTHWSYNYSIPSGDGDLRVRIQGSDNVSNDMTDTFNTSKNIDNTGPTAAITDISNYVSSLTEINGTADDGSGIGVNKTEVKIYNSTDGTNWTGTTWTDADNWNDATGYGTWTLNTSTITWVDGNEYTVYAKSTDNLTNLGSNVTDSFTFDEGDPLVISVLINDTSIGSTTYLKDGDTVNITITYSDATLDSSSSNDLFKANLSSLGGTASTSATGHNDTHAWWVITPSSSGNGTVTVTINVTDDFGNYNNTESDTIIADNIAPALQYAVLDSDNDGTNYTYVDLFITETYLDSSTIAYTDFNISISGVNPAAIQSQSGNRVTIRFDTTFQTGDSPTIGIAGSIADFAGNTLTADTTIIRTFNISLSSGLNLISFPCDVSTEQLTTVLTDLSGSWTIYRYNATENQWQYYSSATGYWPVSVQWNLTGGEGYWLSVGTAQNLLGNYDLWPDPGYAMPSYTLKGQSWNLIGQWQTYNQSAKTDAGGSLACLADTDIGSVWRYNTGGGYTNIFTNEQNMEPGKGYWLWKESTGDKAYTPS